MLFVLNVGLIKRFVCLRLAYCLSVLYMDCKHASNRDEIIVLWLDMQLVGNQNSLRTWVRKTEDFRVLTLEIQAICSVYELD